jgi:hypothetical protein
MQMYSQVVADLVEESWNECNVDWLLEKERLISCESDVVEECLRRKRRRKSTWNHLPFILSCSTRSTEQYSEEEMRSEDPRSHLV